MLPCKETSFGAKVCLVAVNKPLIGDGDPKRLPVLAVKVSTGKAVEKGIEHYLTAPWKEGWEDWLRQAKDAFPSVLEHITLTFHIDGCSRVCSHQLVRHRLVSFTQESQRYTEARILKAIGAEDLKTAIMKVQTLQGTVSAEMFAKMGGAVEITRGDIKVTYKDLKELGLLSPMEEALEACERLSVVPPDVKDKVIYCHGVMMGIVHYFILRGFGVEPEDARYVLPQSIRTSLLATANLREWLHIIGLRTHPKAQWEIREIAEKIAELIEEGLSLKIRQE